MVHAIIEISKGTLTEYFCFGLAGTVEGHFYEVVPIRARVIESMCALEQVKMKQEYIHISLHVPSEHSDKVDAKRIRALCETLKLHLSTIEILKSIPAISIEKLVMNEYVEVP